MTRGYRYLCESCRHCKGWNYRADGEVSGVRCNHIPPCIGRAAYLTDGTREPTEICSSYENAREHREGVRRFICGTTPPRG